MRLINSRFIIAILLVLSFITISAIIERGDGAEGVRSSGSPMMKADLPTGFNDYFAGSGECVQCHSSMVNNAGQSVSIVNDWRSSMMANASKDPFWRAKVSHETLVNPQHAAALEDVCTRCHAPMGHFNAHLGGQELYSIAEMEQDPLALDGASCTVCHQITPESMGNYSGNMVIGEDKKIWGPYEDPFTNPMINHTGYTPEEGDHIMDSRLCGSCHTLITNTVDLNGNLTGTQFVEQAIYHEWLNSDFPETGASCQSCHLPQIQDNVVISTMPPWLGPRTPFGKHHLAGANVFMLRLFKENLVSLGIAATTMQLDSTIARAQRMLQHHSLQLEISDAGRTPDTLYVDLSLQNMAGHKFPAGYPSRRAFITLAVTDESGDTLFHSGEFDEDFELIKEDAAYEPHYPVITSDEQVQIYELVMGDVNYEPTTVLERAFVPLKDNRIPPIGFTTSHASYDTVLIAGAAMEDPDFNKDGAEEGSGLDIVRYHIPVMGSEEDLTVHATVWYQTVSGKWLQPMFEYASDEIDAFKDYYEQADKEPVQVASASLLSMYSSNPDRGAGNITVSPNPAREYVRIDGMEALKEIAYYSMDGKKYTCPVPDPMGGAAYLVSTPPVHGLVLMTCINTAGTVWSFKLVLH